MKTDIAGQLENIRQAADIEARWQLVLNTFESYGFDHIIFMHGDSLPTLQIRTSASEAFMRYHREQRFYRHDPIIRLCAASYHSVRTGVAHFKSMPISAAERRMTNEAHHLGESFNSGFTCTLTPLQQGRFSAWNIGTQLSVRETDCILSSYQADLQQLCYLAPALLSLPSTVPTLSKREQQVLYLLAYGGLHHQQIADELNISASTVRFHLNNIRKKFDAKTSEQAIARAVEAGFLAS